MYKLSYKYTILGYTDLDTSRLYTIEQNPWGIQTPATLQQNVCQEETITWQLVYYKKTFRGFRVGILSNF